MICRLDQKGRSRGLKPFKKVKNGSATEGGLAEKKGVKNERLKRDFTGRREGRRRYTTTEFTSKSHSNSAAPLTDDPSHHHHTGTHLLGTSKSTKRRKKNNLLASASVSVDSASFLETCSFPSSSEQRAALK